MKIKYLFLLALLIPIPAKSITWQEFWRPINRNAYYNRYYNYGYTNQICTKRVYHSENNYGYSRTWSEEVAVPCYRY